MNVMLCLLIWYYADGAVDFTQLISQPHSHCWCCTTMTCRGIGYAKPQNWSLHAVCKCQLILILPKPELTQLFFDLWRWSTCFIPTEVLTIALGVFWGIFEKGWGLWDIRLGQKDCKNLNIATKIPTPRITQWTQALMCHHWQAADHNWQCANMWDLRRESENPSRWRHLDVSTPPELLFNVINRPHTPPPMLQHHEEYTERRWRSLKPGRSISSLSILPSHLIFNNHLPGRRCLMSPLLLISSPTIMCRKKTLTPIMQHHTESIE